MPQIISQLSLTNIVRLINVAWLVILLKIFRFTLLIPNTVLNNIGSVLQVYILQRSPETMNSVPDIQRGQPLINLLLSSRIIVDGCSEDSELPLQWLMKMKVNLLCT